MNSYFAEVTEQPKMLLQTLESVQSGLAAVLPLAHKLQNGDIQRVIFTGMGASYYAIYPTLIYLVQHRIQASSVDASELIHYYSNGIDTKTLVVMISQSGRSVEILRLLEMLPENTPTIGITNTPDSSLAQQCDATLFLQVGEERTVSTKTYTSTLVALQMLAVTLAQQTISPFTEQVSHLSQEIEIFLPIWEEQSSDVVAQLADKHFLSFLARGVSLASAMTGALITKESAKIPTEGMNCAQFRHGPIEVVDEQIAALVFAGDTATRDINLKLAAELASLGAYTTVISDKGQSVQGANMLHIPDVSSWARPIAEIIPIQFIAGKLAERRGFDIGAFRYIRKVTTEE